MHSMLLQPYVLLTVVKQTGNYRHAGSINLLLLGLRQEPLRIQLGRPGQKSQSVSESKGNKTTHQRIDHGETGHVRSQQLEGQHGRTNEDERLQQASGGLPAEESAEGRNSEITHKGGHNAVNESGKSATEESTGQSTAERDTGTEERGQKEGQGSVQTDFEDLFHDSLPFL